MEDGAGAGGPKGGEPAPTFFAVKTTVGHEQQVADGIRERALIEKVEVRSVLAPRALRGYVFVEAADFDRLTNLVTSVKHARGVVRARGSDDPADSSVPIDQLDRFLSGEETKVPQEFLDRMAEGPFKGEKRRVAPLEAALSGGDDAARGAGAGARATGPPPSKPPVAGALPPATPRAARLLNIMMLAPIVIVVLGLLLAPRIFWDGFLYPYFWSSIEADANNVGGSAEAYNIVNTLAYALILIPAVILIYRVLERLKVAVDARFILMLTPFLVLGGAARALEDAEYFSAPLAYAFISPLIYLAEGLFVLLLVVASWWVARTHKERGAAWGAAAWSAAFAPGALALAYFHMSGTGGLSAPVPAPIVTSALACAYLAGLILVQKGRAPGVHGLVLNAGLLLLALSAYLIARWIVVGGWEGAPPSAAPTHAGEVPVIVGIAGAATALTVFGLYLASGRFPRLSLLVSPINGLVFFAQYLDGAATFWGIDMFGYQEKHVVPSFLISLTGSAAVMLPLKCAFVLFVSYFTDVLYRKDLYTEGGEMGSFAGLLKLTVAALGMGPGTRDMLRLAMGV